MLGNIPYIDLAGMTPAEWDAYRKQSIRIGGSDIGTILGLNKYSDAITLWAEKCGLITSNFQPSEATEGGHLDEAGILKRLEYWDGMQWVNNLRAEKTFRKIAKPTCTYLPEEFPFAAINVDGIITDDHDYPGKMGIAEAKKIASQVMSSYPGGVVPTYICQVVFYMMGLNLDFAYIAMLEDGVRLNVRTFDRAMPEVQIIESKILEVAPRFYAAVQDGRQVMETITDVQERNNAMMEVIAEYSDVLTVTHLSRLFVEMDQDTVPRKQILTDESMANVMLAYEKAVESKDYASQEEGRLRNTIIQYLLKNDAYGVSTAQHRATYNKRFTFKKL